MAGRPRNRAATTAILAAAIAILRERGYERLTLDEVANVAGVGKSSLYLRFGGRAELAAAALASVQREIPPPKGELRQDLLSSLRAAEHNLGHAGAAVIGCLSDGAEASGTHLDRMLAPFTRQVQAQLELARAQGAVAASSDLEAAVELLVGVLLSRVLRASGIDARWPEREVDVVLGSLGS